MKIRLAGFFLPLLWAGSLAAQTPVAKAVGIAVNTATLNQTATSATLPADGGTVQNQSGDVTVGTFVTAQDVFATVGGAPDGTNSDAVSSVTLGTVSILSGLITADGLVAMATSTAGNSNADGSSLSNLVVSGVQISDPAPNTRVNLPGVGYAVLNEQIATASGITVNMIHVVLQQALPLGGSVTTGNIIVGSATSSVN